MFDSKKESVLKGITTAEMGLCVIAKEMQHAGRNSLSNDYYSTYGETLRVCQ